MKVCDTALFSRVDPLNKNLRVFRLSLALCIMMACHSLAGETGLNVDTVYQVNYSDLTSRHLPTRIPEEAQRALNERGNIDYFRWLFRDLVRLRSGPIDVSEIPSESRRSLPFIAYTVMHEGFTYASSYGTVRYEVVECRLFDCYKAYLSLQGDDANLIWRRRIPFIDLPVFPFEVDGSLLYLGGKTEVTMLYSVDLASGKLSQGFTPVNNMALEATEPERFFPYYYRGFVCVAEDFQFKLNLEKKKSSLVNDPRVFAIKLAEEGTISKRKP